MPQRPLLGYLPELSHQVHFAELGRFPTRVHELNELLEHPLPSGAAFIKRDDESAAEYGGNKLRTLEVLLGSALQRGASRVYSTGAFGSNHATATAIHAPRLKLESGAVLFPQPCSRAALDNLRVTAARTHHLVALPHWSALPFEAWRIARRFGSRVMIMQPGGATPEGALGYVSAALELAEQVRAKTLPSPERIIVGVGSTCTSAGLLVGLRVARTLGLAFERRLPQVVAVRVSPWPVTSPLRITWLARRTAELLVQLASAGHRFDYSFAELRRGLTLDRRFIGSGYGQPTESGRAAIDRFGHFGVRALDTTYSAKSAAALLKWFESDPRPTLYWATKSSAPLPLIDTRELARSPQRMLTWLAQCERNC